MRTPPKEGQDKKHNQIPQSHMHEFVTNPLPFTHPPPCTNQATKNRKPQNPMTSSN
jgi:hypothetical protein